MIFQFVLWQFTRGYRQQHVTGACLVCGWQKVDFWLVNLRFIFGWQVSCKQNSLNPGSSNKMQDTLYDYVHWKNDEKRWDFWAHPICLYLLDVFTGLRKKTSKNDLTLEYTRHIFECHKIPWTVLLDSSRFPNWAVPGLIIPFRKKHHPEKPIEQQ